MRLDETSVALAAAARNTRSVVSNGMRRWSGKTGRRLCQPAAKTTSSPNYYRRWTRLLIRVEKGQYEGVEAGLEALLREHPHYHTTNFAMGAYLLATREDTERAIPFFQKAVSVFPPMAEAHYNLGSCYIKSCRIPEAVASLRKAIRYSANNDLVAGKARDQLQFLEKLLTDRSPFQTLDAYVENQKLFDLAFENLQARRYEAAIDMFSRVLAQSPGHVQSHGNLALAYEIGRA